MTYGDDSLGDCDGHGGLRIARSRIDKGFVAVQCGYDGEAKLRRRFWRPK